MLALGDTGLRLAALQARSIDAAMLSPPHSFFAQRQGFNNLMWMGDLGGDGQPTNGLSTTEKKIKEQPDQLRRMLRATVRSMVYVHENKDKALPIVLKEFASWDREAVLQAYDFIVRGMSRDGTVSPSILQEIINEERAISGRNADVPVTQLADFEPLHRVLKEIK
jgi:ABC-type nitrate/sulfonate/bicarbonate transport system substrate-binding protein